MSSKVMSKQKRKFGVYHWDTFDNETLFLADFDRLSEAYIYILEKYGDRISDNGADQVDLVKLDGTVLDKFKVT
jgi:hypothetical protein